MAFAESTPANEPVVVAGGAVRGTGESNAEAIGVTSGGPIGDEAGADEKHDAARKTVAACVIRRLMSPVLGPRGLVESR